MIFFNLGHFWNNILKAKFGDLSLQIEEITYEKERKEKREKGERGGERVGQSGEVSFFLLLQAFQVLYK